MDIVRIDRFDLTYEPWEWPFAQERQDEITEHFETRRRRTPELWNGRVLVMRDREIEGSILRGRFFDVDFASFMAWRDWGFPGERVTDCFGMGALRGSDGAFLLGVMAQNTANAGHIYFPCGTPDLEDVRDGHVDLAANVRREVGEETGLTTADFSEEPGWHAVVGGAHVAMVKVLTLPAPAEAVRTRVLSFLARETKPELADIRVLRSVADIAPQMPEFVTTFLQAAFR